MKKHLLILFLFITELTSSFAYENFNFHVLDVRSGISDNYIQDILHDKYGFMWFATRNGLSRYDGYHYKQYTITQLGSYDNNFERIFEDGSGTIWIKSPILYCFYNREEDAFDNDVSGRIDQ